MLADMPGKQGAWAACTPRTECSPAAQGAKRQVRAALDRKEALAVPREALQVGDGSAEAALGIEHPVPHARNRGKGSFAGLIVAFVHDQVYPSRTAAERTVGQCAEDTRIVLRHDAVDYGRMRRVGERYRVFAVVHLIPQ